MHFVKCAQHGSVGSNAPICNDHAHKVVLRKSQVARLDRRENSMQNAIVIVSCSTTRTFPLISSFMHHVEQL